MKGEDRKQKLDMLESELKSVGDRLSFIYGQFSGMLRTSPAYTVFYLAALSLASNDGGPQFSVDCGILRQAVEFAI